MVSDADDRDDHKSVLSRVSFWALMLALPGLYVLSFNPGLILCHNFPLLRLPFQIIYWPMYEFLCTETGRTFEPLLRSNLEWWKHLLGT